MPRTEGIPAEEAREIEFFLKKFLSAVGSNVTDTVRLLNETYGTADTPQAVTRQLKKGTIPFWKVLRMAAVHKCKIDLQKEESI